jgi:hypothetical protein
MKYKNKPIPLLIICNHISSLQNIYLDNDLNHTVRLRKDIYTLRAIALVEMISSILRFNECYQVIVLSANLAFAHCVLSLALT